MLLNLLILFRAYQINNLNQCKLNKAIIICIFRLLMHNGKSFFLNKSVGMEVIDIGYRWLIAHYLG